VVTSNNLREAQRFWFFPCAVCAAVSVVVACSSGGSGDGVTDDGSSLPGGATSIGTGKAGAKNHGGGATSQAGAAAGGAGGNAGAGGSGGQAGAGGSGGKAGGGGAAGASGAATAGNAGVNGSSGSAGNGAGGDLGSSGTGGMAGSSAGGSGGTAGLGGSTTCGDGVVQLGEQCDDKGPSPICSNTCFQVQTPDCYACENDPEKSCVDSVNNCLGPTDTPFSDVQQAQCYAVMACIELSHCFVGSGTLGGACYCGTLSVMQCQAAAYDLSKPGAPNGPCAAAIQAGLPGLSTNSAVLGGLTAKAKPAGAGMQRLNCMKTADQAHCSKPCGLD